MRTDRKWITPTSSLLHIINPLRLYRGLFIAYFSLQKPLLFFFSLCFVWRGMQGRCTRVHVIKPLFNRSSQGGEIIATNVIYYVVVLITASMYCYFIVLVGNWIFLVVLCVDYINLLYITLETLYVYNFTFVVKLLFMSMPLLTNTIRNPTKSYIIIFLK